MKKQDTKRVSATKRSESREGRGKKKQTAMHPEERLSGKLSVGSGVALCKVMEGFH